MQGGILEIIQIILSDKHLDGAGQSLRHFLDKFKQWYFHSPSNDFQITCRAILAILQTGPGWPCPVSTALKNISLAFKNSLCFGFL